MTVSVHKISAWVGATELGVISADITLDETWSPYAQGSITIPLDTNIISLIDPRNNARIKLFLLQTFGISQPLSTLSSTYAGKKILDLTTAWNTKTIAQLSAAYFTPFNTSLPSTYKNFERQFDLAIRSRTINVNDSTITIELASDEALLQDYALVQSTNFSPNTTDLRTIVKGVLARIGDSLTTGTTTATIDANASLWAPGQNAWDYLTAMISQAKLRLFCDEQRNWYLVNDTYTATGLTELYDVQTITSAAENINRNNDDWFDAVVVKYTWTNDAGANVVTYDTAYTLGFKKTKLIEINSLYPGAGAAQRILNRAISRGISKDVSAVNNYQVTPSTACNIYLTGYATENGYVRSVTWSLPSDVMTVKTRQPVNN